MNKLDPDFSRPLVTPFRTWWKDHVVSTVEHRAVVEKVHDDASWSAHYAFMTLMSAGIAVLGLLLSSPAVVIGAMLISPLMGPIIGLGFGLALFDAAEIKRTVASLALGVLLAVAFCALVVLLSPLQTVTDEIAARTRPNLFDLLVALFSGLAGTYAMIRGRHGTIVGVAIATALMPPLAVVGFGIATASWAVFLGASLLFVTNLMTIAVAAAILARIYGFAGNLSPRQTTFQAALVLATFATLGIPLALSLNRIAWETVASRQASEVIARHFGENARLSDISIDFDRRPIAIDATVLTPEFKRDAEKAVREELQANLRRPIELTIDQFRVAAQDGAEAAQIAAARGGTSDRGATRLAERLALVAGVAPDQVLIDRVNTRALVRAAPLPGADLASYRALERRVAEAEPRWTIMLIPPAAALPEVALEDGAPSERGREAIATAVWAGQRLNLPLGVSARRAADAERVIADLAARGVTARQVPGAAPAGSAALQWLAPETPGQEEPETP